MVGSLVERGIENAVDDLFDEKTARVVKKVGKAAVKGAGKKLQEGNHLIGKKTLIGLGAVVIGAQIATTAVGLAILHRVQVKRTERVMRRVIREELEKAKPES